MFSMKGADNLLCSDLFSENTVMSPNYKPPKDF